MQQSPLWRPRAPSNVPLQLSQIYEWSRAQARTPSSSRTPVDRLLGESILRRPQRTRARAGPDAARSVSTVGLSSTYSPPTHYQ